MSAHAWNRDWVEMIIGGKSPVEFHLTPTSEALAARSF